MNLNKNGFHDFNKINKLKTNKNISLKIFDNLELDYSQTNNFNTIAIGGPGCGKTFSYIKPNIENMKFSYIYYSNDLMDDNDEFLKKNNYSIYDINDRNFNYNIFKDTKSKKHIDFLVDSYLYDWNRNTVDRDFFIKINKKFLKYGLNYILDKHGEINYFFIDYYFKWNSSDFNKGLEKIMSFVLTKSIWQSSVEAISNSFLNDFKYLTDSNINDDYFSIKDLMNDKFLLRVIVDSYKNTDFINSIFNVFSLYFYLYSKDNKVNNPVMFFVDEFLNSGFIDLDIIDNIISLFKQDIYISYCIQSLAQLNCCEKKLNLISFIGKFNINILFKVLDEQTIKCFSDMFNYFCPGNGFLKELRGYNQSINRFIFIKNLYNDDNLFFYFDKDIYKKPYRSIKTFKKNKAINNSNAENILKTKRDELKINYINLYLDDLEESELNILYFAYLKDIDISLFFEKQKLSYNENQIKELYLGLKENIDIEIFLNKDIDHISMRNIRNELMISKYF